jgi:hypothetical protein
VRNLTLQTATVSGSGVAQARVWANTSTIAVTLLPASRRDAELANLRGERVTHSAIAPAGLTVDAVTNRFLDGTTVYRVSTASSTPRGVVLVLEATT